LVSRRDIGILAVLGIGAFFLFRKASGFEGVPADPFNFQREKQLQTQFDEVGDVLTQQDTALTESQSIIQRLLNTITGLQTPQTPQSTSVRVPLNPTSGILTSTNAGRDVIVNTFGKVPSNFVQGFKTACSCGSRRCSALQFGKCNQSTGLFEK